MDQVFWRNLFVWTVVWFNIGSSCKWIHQPCLSRQMSANVLKYWNILKYRKRKPLSFSPASWQGIAHHKQAMLFPRSYYQLFIRVSNIRERKRKTIHQFTTVENKKPYTLQGSNSPGLYLWIGSSNHKVQFKNKKV